MISELISRVELVLLSRYTFEEDAILNLTQRVDLLKRIRGSLPERKMITLVSNFEIYPIVKKSLSHPCLQWDYSYPLTQSNSFLQICPSDKFRVISDFSGFEKAFQSPDRFKGVLHNIQKYLQTGGYLIVIGFNGERTNTILSTRPEIKRYYKDNLIWKMSQNYSSWSLTQPNWNRTVLLSTGDHSPREKILVDFDYLIRVSSQYQLQLVHWTPLEKFQEDNSISDPDSTYYEKELSYYNDIMILKKLG